MTTPGGSALAATCAGLILVVAIVSILGVPLVAEPQPAEKLARVGYLSSYSASTSAAQQALDLFSVTAPRPWLRGGQKHRRRVPMGREQVRAAFPACCRARTCAG